MSAVKGQEMQTEVQLNDPTGGYHFKDHSIGERIFLSIFVKYSMFHVPESQDRVKWHAFLKIVINIQIPHQQVISRSALQERL
jgi:hypothetical protein